MLCGIWLGSIAQTSRGDQPSTAPISPRSNAQIVADINASIKDNRGFLRIEQFRPGKPFAKLDDPLQHLVNLIRELEQIDAPDAAPYRLIKCQLLVRLALCGHRDAVQSLTDLSNSAVAADAVLGKAGTLMYRWWNSADAATQQSIASEMSLLAKANPREDLLAYAAAWMAGYGADSDEVTSGLRHAVDVDLTGPGALALRQQPAKLGWPLKLTVQTIGGGQFSISEWRGKVVLIDFWATWCPVCMSQTPVIIQLYQKEHPKGLEIVGIANDRLLPDVRNFLAAHKEMVWPESFSPSGPQGLNAVWYRMGINHFPYTFLIDRNGILRDMDMSGFNPNLINQLLAEPAPIQPASISAVDNDPVAEPTTAQSTDHSATTPDARNQEAQSLLSLANSYIAANRADLAKSKLNQLLERFPDTDAAPKARSLLLQLAD